MKKVLVFLVVLYLALFSWIGRVKAIELVEAAATSVEYPLPYPGMLPDSPFYFLKVARDSLVTWLIADPVKKSFYLVLLADKRVGAGEVLVNSGKTALGVATLIKAEEYYKQAVDLMINQNSTLRLRSGQELKTQNSQGVNDLLSKLVVAGAKHGEVLGKISGVDVTTARQINAESRKRVMELLLKRRD